MKTLPTFALMLGCALLSSCESGGDSTAATRVLTPSDMLAQVRASGRMGNELDVQPWRDPQVEDLRAAATAAESRGDNAAADKALQHALQLSPDEPELLQWRAELALLRRDWAQAEQLAARSFDKGPKLGGLCRRSWSTIRFAREARADAANAAIAQQRIATCAVTPPPRY
jgi:hypothetical protein